MLNKIWDNQWNNKWCYFHEWWSKCLTPIGNFYWWLINILTNMKWLHSTGEGYILCYSTNWQTPSMFLSTLLPSTFKKWGNIPGAVCLCVCVHLSLVRHHPIQLVSVSVAVSCGYDTWFAVRLVMDYTQKAQCVSHLYPQVDCHSQHMWKLRERAPLPSSMVIRRHTIKNSSEVEIQGMCRCSGIFI